MYQYCRSNRWTVWFLCGLLFGLAFLYSYTAVLVLPALYIFIYLYTVAQSRKEIFFGSLIVGSLKASGGIIWFWYAYPIDWVAAFAPSIQLCLIGLIWATCSLSLGIGFALICSLCKLYIKKTDLGIFLLPLVFVVAEMMGSLTFSLYTLGPGSVPNMQFSFGYIGYLLADTPFFLPLAHYGGVYALSFFAVFFVLVLFVALSRTYVSNVFKISGVYVCALLLLAHGYHIYVQQQNTIDTKKIISIETKFPSSMLNTERGFDFKKSQVLEAVDKALDYAIADYILLPEDSRFSLAFRTPQQALAYLIARNTDVVLIDSARITETNGETVLRAFIYDTNAETVSMIDKQYLVPQGEFIPYLSGALINLGGSEKLRETLFTNQSYKPGPIRTYALVPKNIPPILFCMESIAPMETERLLREQPSHLLLHQISHGWFHEPTILWRNLERMLKVQTVWNNVSIVEASNMKTSQAFDTKGNIVKPETLAARAYWNLWYYVIQ